jgi:hypothetical protein
MTGTPGRPSSESSWWGAKTAAPPFVGASRTSYVQLPNRSAGALRDRSPRHRVVALFASERSSARKAAQAARSQPRTSFASSAPTLRPWISSSADLSPRGRARAVRAFSYRHSAQSGFPGADTGADANRDAARKPRPERRGKFVAPSSGGALVASSARRVNSSWRGGPAAHPERRGRACRPPRHR